MTLLAPQPSADLAPAAPAAAGGTGYTPVPQPKAGRFRAMTSDLSTARKLGLLTVVCLLPSVALFGVSTRSTAAANDQAQVYESVQLASAELFHLDTRNSEIKADAFRSLIPGDGANVAVTDLADDITSATDVLATLQAIDLPSEMEGPIDDLDGVAATYYDAVDSFVADATDGEGPALTEQTVINANHTLDNTLEDLRAVADDQLATLDQDLEAAQKRANLLMIVVTLLGLALGVAIATWIARAMVRRLQATVDILEHVADGNLDRRLEVDSSDEVGRMGVALNAALGRLSSTMGQMDHNAQSLASASEELSAVSGEMSGSASESSSQAGLVSAAAEQVSRNVQTVATGTEEMSASIREIAHNASNAAGVAAQAVVVAESTTATVAKLGDSSAEVGNVIKVINSIAEQTNLLALNATIEAARAGEAGKGFAVVANEVKELAQETGKATEDIGRRIEAIQVDTQAAVTAIAEIAEIIGQINDTQSTIASAVEEQTATTNEMSRNVAEAATGSADIAMNVTGVARSASDTQAAANSTSQAADELARMAAQVRSLVGQFTY